jgi:hypothetical protein
MSSRTAFAGTNRLTSRTRGARLIPATGTMSRRKLKLSLSYSVALIVPMSVPAGAYSRQVLNARPLRHRDCPLHPVDFPQRTADQDGPRGVARSGASVVPPAGAPTINRFAPKRFAPVRLGPTLSSPFGLATSMANMKVYGGHRVERRGHVT